VGVCRDHPEGLLVITAGAGDVLRLLPPLVVTAEEVDRAIVIIAEAINGL
jgi:acetylornithine aminotransferase